MVSACSSDELNKSQIPVGEDFGEKKGKPAGHPGRGEDVVQAALMLSCNQYAYGQTLAIDGGISSNPFESRSLASVWILQT